ncbi:hypothetical protein RFI_26556 [Reticulomyxa filosa]|uniref:N-acetyltransferase domain-containing protein n=1 Tax=Reticulomyxa filosa TaxID=46433 RepID=X6MB00_RETFI|nr:hypothetical protein RFI_26556 [Reticulomyxa filosa]|eukprot:ETO10821.1 hypothetical protein RFI_26556 [Reticulomyxa filosa]
MQFYMHYMCNWPEYFKVALGPNNDIMGYLIGKAEGSDQKWHGHVSAVTVAPEYRRLGLATDLMKYLEKVTNELHKAWFVDLFVRSGNAAAIKFYQHLGYSIYRKVLKYYSDNKEDAYGLSLCFCSFVSLLSSLYLSGSQIYTV